MMIEENYQDGVRQGRSVTYHRNGSPLSEGQFINGNREGDFRIYDECGRHVKSLLFINNILIEEIEERII